MANSESDGSDRGVSPEVPLSFTPSTSASTGGRRHLNFGRRSDDPQQMILAEVKKTNSSLDDVSSRIDSMERRLKEVEQKQDDILTSPSSCSSSVKDTTKVPTKIRNAVREFYKTYLEDDEFLGFDVKKRFTDKYNQDIVKRICHDMKLDHPSVGGSIIRMAARRFFLSQVEKESLKAKGKYADKVKRQRRQNRINRKLKDRQSTLNKSALDPKDKEKWNQVLTADFISSEESAEEEDDAIAVKPLLWRADQVTRFFKKLDDLSISNKSSQAKRQRKTRIIRTDYSERKQPKQE